MPKTVEVPEPALQAAAAVAIEDDDVETFVEAEAPRRRAGGRGWVGWAALVLIIAAISGGGYFARYKIVALWPPAATLYALLDPGMARVNALGIELRDVTAKFSTEDDTQVLLVSGKITSISDVVRTIPRIRINLLDKDEKEIFYWTFSVEKTELEPRASVPFSTRLANPPAKIAGLEATFVADASPAGGGTD